MRPILKAVILAIRGILLRVISPFLFRARRRKFLDDQIKRILIIRIDGIGDMVLTIPAIKALRQRFPSAHITVMTLEATKDLLRGALYIDEVIVYQKGLRLKELSFDLIFDFLDNYFLKPALIAYSIKAKYRVGFDIKGRGVFFNLRIPHPNDDRHYVDSMLDLVALVGARIDDRFPELIVPPSEQNKAVQFLRDSNIQEGDRIVCIHPGAIHWTGRWPPELFARLADELIQKKLAKVIFFGADYDIALIDQIRMRIKEESLFYIGQPLQSVAALIQQSDMLICNNSGLLHVACALKVPTVSTMGPALPKKWWPVGSKNIVLRQESLLCIGCGKGYCRIKTHDCMRKITFEDMFEAVESQLQ